MKYIALMNYQQVVPVRSYVHRRQNFVIVTFSFRESSNSSSLHVDRDNNHLLEKHHPQSFVVNAAGVRRDVLCCFSQRSETVMCIMVGLLLQSSSHGSFFFSLNLSYLAKPILSKKMIVQSFTWTYVFDIL